MRVTPLFLLILTLPCLAQEPAAKKLLPDDAAQKDALSVVAEVHKPDYERARTPAQKIELAKKLLDEGIATKDDPTSRFVLFRVARDIASQQGDLTTAFEAIGRIGAEFEADTLPMKLDAATLAVKALKTPKDHQACAAILASLVGEAVSSDHYDLAKSLASLALGSAREGRDAERIKQLTSKTKEIEAIAAEFEVVKEAKVALDAKPTDPVANFAVGKFLCFAKGDWQRGVTMLALGTNEELKATALLELEENPDPLKVGDGWWKISEGLDGTAKSQAQAHAAGWYRKALPGLSGLSKARVEKRIADGEVTKWGSSSLVPLTKPQGTPSIEGNWEEGPGIVFSIKQRGDRFTANTTYKHAKAGEIQAVVIGTISKDGKIAAILSHTKAPANWVKNQKREAVLSPDTKTISGRATFDGDQHDFVWKRQEQSP